MMSQGFKRGSKPNPAESLGISSATAQVVPDLLKALKILSNIPVRRSAVDWEDLKPHWKLEKGHISLVG